MRQHMCLITGQPSGQHLPGPALHVSHSQKSCSSCLPTSCVRLIELPDGISGQCLCSRQLACMCQCLRFHKGHPLRLSTPCFDLWAGRAHLVWDDCLKAWASMQLLAGLKGQKRMSGAPPARCDNCC